MFDEKEAAPGVGAPGTAEDGLTAVGLIIPVFSLHHLPRFFKIGRDENAKE